MDGRLNCNTKNKIIGSIWPNYLWQIDPIGRSTEPNNINKFIFVAIDHFLNWIEAPVIEYKSNKNVQSS